MIRRTACTAALVAVVLAAMALTGCGGEETTARTDGGFADAVTEPTLEQFFDADSKTGTFTVTRTSASDGSVSEMTGEFWVDGRKFKIALYEDGKLIRDITSPDGENAYFVEHAEKSSRPSVASVDRYLLEFTEPGGEAVEDGVDEETGATRMLFAIKRLDDITGAANAWYTEDVTYLVKDGEVIGVITRGDTPNEDGSPYDLDVSRRMFENLAVGEQIPAETFELPYPVEEAK